MIVKGSLVKLNEHSSVYRVSHFDEQGINAYLLPAPTVPNGTKYDRKWHRIAELIEVQT